MDSIRGTVESIRSLHVRKLLLRLITIGLAFTSASMIWMGLECATGTQSPIVAVFSGSMEPGFRRGDLLVVQMTKDPIRVGDIVVYNTDGAEIPHRVIKVHDKDSTGETVDILTQGDNNFDDDISLYKGQKWLNPQHIMGKAVGFVPYAGWPTFILPMIMPENPMIKYILTALQFLVPLVLANN